MAFHLDMSSRGTLEQGLTGDYVSAFRSVDAGNGKTAGREGDGPRARGGDPPLARLISKAWGKLFCPYDGISGIQDIS